jgi:tetratricopeptide (TPR) repeat protein
VTVDTLDRIQTWVNLDAMGEWTRLHEFALEWITNQPTNPLAWQAFGTALRKLRRPSDAIAAFTQGIAVAPPPPLELFGRRPAGPLWFNLAHAYVEAGEADLAKAAFREAARIDPSVAEIWNDLGVVCMNSSDVPAALEAFTRAVKLDGNNVNNLKNLGTVYALCKIDEGVRFVYQQLLPLDRKAALDFLSQATQLMSK